LFAGTSRCTSSIIGTLAPRLIGAKSRSIRCGARPAASSAAVVVLKVRLWNSSVCPSGAALATTSAPIDPPAPPRFSTTTETPSVSVSRCA
jgi:hypothetical protein